MGRIVCVHGIGQQVAGEHSLLRDWTPSLLDGLARAGHSDAATTDDVVMGFYGHLFRPAGARLAVGDPMFSADDVEAGLEQDLLLAWWREAALVDPKVAPPEADTLVRAPGSVQAALRQLSRSRFFGGLALRAMVFDLKQVSRYLQDQQLRDAARRAVRKLITTETRVVVAHSLGSLVAYEVLAAIPDHQVQALVTLGSPLGIPNLIFHRLDPTPRDGLGAWPGPDRLVWTNVADYGDVVALEKDLRPRFGPRVISAVVHNGAHAHAVTAYLTEQLTGAAIAGGLSEQ
ncbi:hypothetical protein [Amycolatopsis sp. NPDC004169]|uniref:hypothetical protein n=1 Tax=Amycolatopsis sp. NPDC004169 TaxID=3154453 RepID=UPI0033A9B7F0